MTLSWATKLGIFLVSLLLPFVIGLTVLASLQTSFLFPVSSVAPAPSPAGGIAIAIKAADGEIDLRGWYVQPWGALKGKAVILGFGGNAWNAARLATTLHQLFPKDDIVTFAYRGYPPSGGSPSASAILADSAKIYDRASLIADGRPIVAVGFSLGAGVAADLVRYRTLNGLILVTPFDTLERVAADHMPWVPVSLIFKHQIDASTALRSSSVPVAIVAASDDSIVPRTRTDQLRKDVANLVFDHTLDGATHNDIYAHPDFAPTMAAARKSLRI